MVKTLLTGMYIMGQNGCYCTSTFKRLLHYFFSIDLVNIGQKVLLQVRGATTSTLAPAACRQPTVFHHLLLLPASLDMLTWVKQSSERHLAAHTPIGIQTADGVGVQVCICRRRDIKLPRITALCTTCLRFKLIYGHPNMYTYSSFID